MRNRRAYLRIEFPVAKRLSVEDIIADVTANATLPFPDGAEAKGMIAAAPSGVNAHLQQAYEQQRDLWQNPVTGARQGIKRIVHSMIFFVLHRQFALNTHMMDAISQLDEEVVSLRAELELRIETLQGEMKALQQGEQTPSQVSIARTLIASVQPAAVLSIAAPGVDGDEQAQFLASALGRNGLLVHAALPTSTARVDIFLLHEFARQRNLPHAPLPLDTLHFDMVYVHWQADDHQRRSLMQTITPLLAAQARALIVYTGAAWNSSDWSIEWQDGGDLFHDDRGGLRLLLWA